MSKRYRTVDGFMDAMGGNPPLRYVDTVWNDIKAPFTTTRRGATSKPDFDYTNLGLLFPQNDDAEITYAVMQFGHDRKNGSNISPHIHWLQMNTNAVVWKCAYKWFDNGDTVPANFTTLTSATATTNQLPYTSGSMLQISEFPTIDGSSITGVSSILLVKVWRDDNVDAGAGGGDALAWEWDAHYEIDTPSGSHSEYSKD